MRSKALLAVLSICWPVRSFLARRCTPKSIAVADRPESPSRGAPSGSKANVPPQGGYGNSGLKPDKGTNPVTGGYGNTGLKPPGSAPTMPGKPAQSSGYGNTATPPQTKGRPAGPGSPKRRPAAADEQKLFKAGERQSVRRLQGTTGQIPDEFKARGLHAFGPGNVHDKLHSISCKLWLRI